MRPSWFSSFVHQRSARPQRTLAPGSRTVPKTQTPGEGLAKWTSQVKLTNRIVGKRKVSSRKRKKVEHRRTEGDPRNTQASFRLQDFKMWKSTVLLLLALPPSVNSKETPTPRMCAVCLEKDCANGVTRIYLADDTVVWSKENSQDEIQICTMENLKADSLCKMANNSLVQPADNPLQFEGTDSDGGGRIFKSQISPCDDLGLPSSSKPSATTHNTSSSNPSTNLTNSTTSPGPAPVTGSNTIAIVSACIPVAALIVAGFGGLIYKKRLYNWLRGQDRGRRQGNNRVPPHDTEHRDEIAIEIQPLNAEVANGNVNGVHREDDSVGTAGSLGHCNDSPV